jgi:hypothetical protein
VTVAKKAKGGAKGSGASSGGQVRRVEAALDPVTSGLALAAVIAGPSLWSLYSVGNIDLTTALLHGGLVALGCGVGISGINQLIADYRVRADRERRIRQMMDTLEGVVHEGLPIQPDPAAHPATHPAALPAIHPAALPATHPQPPPRPHPPAGERN